MLLDLVSMLTSCSEYLFSRVADFAGQQGINVEKGLDW